MAEGGSQQGLGRLVLKALAIASALVFLAVVMVNACAHSTRSTHYMAPTKAAPVVNPNPDGMRPGAAPPPEPEPAPPQQPMLAPATKSAVIVKPRPLIEPAAAQRQAAPPQQATPQGAR